ncbi:MAG: hypothetical protein IKM42_03385, partial [Clostridia bacterium]|nr:hypothetical protein [Clostridia bacterium]
MSVSKMEKLTVILPHDEVDAVLRRLMRLGTVSLSREEAGELTAAGLDPGAAAKAAAQAARIDAVLPLLTKRSHRKKPLFSIPVPFDPTEFKQSGDEEKAWKTVAEVEKVTEGLTALKGKLAEEDALMQSLIPYLDFKFSLDDKGTKTAALLLGSLPAGIKEERIEALGNEIGFVFEVLSSDSRGVYLAVITHRQTEQDTLRALSALGFLKASIPKTNGHATAIFDAAQSRANKIKSDIERLDARLDVLAENLTEVEILSDLAHTALLTEQNKEALLSTKKCAVLTGWCPTRERERVSRA